MTWHIYNKIKGKYVWKCIKKTCPKHKTTYSIRSGPKLEDCRDLNIVIFATYLWTVGNREVCLSAYRTCPL